MRKIWLLFSQGVTVALAALLVVSTLKPAWLPESMRPAVPTGTTTVVPIDANS